VTIDVHTSTDGPDKGLNKNCFIYYLWSGSAIWNYDCGRYLVTSIRVHRSTGSIITKVFLTMPSGFSI